MSSRRLDEPTRPQRAISPRGLTASSRDRQPAPRRTARPARGPAAGWWNPLRVALLTGTLVYLAGVLFRLPCRDRAGAGPLQVPVLLRHRLLYAGARAAAGQHSLPRLRRLSGAGVSGAHRLVPRAGADPHPRCSAAPQGTEPQSTEQQVDVDADLRRRQHRAARRAASWSPSGPRSAPCPARPWDAHDAGRLALRRRRGVDQLGPAAGRADRAAAMLAWARRRPGLAGVLLGLGHGGQALSAASCSARCCCSACAAGGCPTS